MAMPDKIRIIGVERNKNGAFGSWTTRPFNGEVYIRKDALLEWLKAKRAPFMGDNDYGKGNIDALDEVINKLNEI